MLGLLALACADEINRIQSSEAGGDGNAVVFGHHALEEESVTIDSDKATLKDVKFISKISPTVSLLVTEKNVTWKYDEVANTLTEISYNKNKDYNSKGEFVQSGNIEYAFSEHLLRMYVRDSKIAKLVAVPSTAAAGGEHSTPVYLDEGLYDATKPPRILYLDAETEDKDVPAVLLFTYGKNRGKDVGQYVLNSSAMLCDGEGPSEVKLGGIGDKFDLPSTRKGSAGIASDGKSFWVLTEKGFALVLWQNCELKDKEGSGEKEKEYDYNGFPFNEGTLLSVTHKGKNAGHLPLGVWIDVSDKEKPFIDGKIIAIDENGKLLTADEPSPPE